MPAKNLRVTKPNGADFYLVYSPCADRIYHVEFRDTKGACTCPEFLANWNLTDWRCEHLIAVEEVKEMEERKAFDAKEPTEKKVINRSMLEKPFESSQIKQRQGSFGDVLDYVEAHHVIRRLNDAFEADWSFEVERYDVKDDEVVVLGKLTAGGVAKMQFGASEITTDDAGKVVSLGDDLKAAATSAIRKCATLFGVGLHLYDDRRNPENRPSPQLPETTPPAAKSGDGRLTNKQLATIYAIAKARGLSRQEVEKNILETYSKRPDYLTKQEASAVIQELDSLPSSS